MKKLIAIPVFFSLMLFSFGTVWAAPQTPPSAPVTVVNTTGNPVPVTGSTTVSGSVSITGTPSVSITGIPSVTVANPESSPALTRNVDNPAFQPIELKASVNFHGGAGDIADAVNLDGTAFTVPTGNRLVVEYLSALLLVPTGERGILFGFAKNGVVYVRVPFVFGGSVGTSGDEFIGGQLVRAYFDEGAPVTVHCAKTRAVGANLCDVSIIGYLVKLP